MAQGRKTSVVLHLTSEQRQVLTSWQRSTTMRAGLAKRSRIILMLAEGASISHISRTVDIQRRFIYKWAERFRKHGIAGLHDKAGRGRKPFFSSGRCDASGPDGVRAA
jgi:transposase-like protein